MADYTEDAIEFYNDVAEDGGEITIIVPVRDEVDEEDADSDVVNPEDWKGNDDEPINITHVGLFDYIDRVSTDKSKYLSKMYIPAYKLEQPITADMFIRDAQGTEYGIDKASPYAPDGKTTIFYTCEMHRWPAS